MHNQAIRYEDKGNEIILIGHNGHPEVEGTSGRVKKQVYLVENVADVAKLKVKNPEQIAYVTQTTLSVDDTRAIIEALRVKFPNIQGPDINDICYATQNRQDAVKKISKIVDLLLVIGSQNSSNSNRLRDIGEEHNIAAYLICGKEDIQSNWLDNISKIGISAGASAPEILVESVIEYLATIRDIEIKPIDGIQENIVFNIPKELR